MNISLEKHLSKLDSHQTRNAYMLHGDINMRACCKSLRERLKRLLPIVDHHVVWLRVEGGVLLLVAGPYIISRLLSDFAHEYNCGVIADSKLLYSGTGKRIIRQLVKEVLDSGCLTNGQRSFGASRRLNQTGVGGGIRDLD